ncbi:MAG: hypothetical protein K0B07_01965 [DPANN group archaeon]|nr:hypothetical protein [DPANN group archaeon]
MQKKTVKNNLIPAIKKDLKSFMLEEKGGASKQTLISMGALLAGIDVVGFLSKVVAGAQLSALHDHCDPGHGSGGAVGWGVHSSADGVPESHCSGHSSHDSHDSDDGWGGWHGSVNVAHKNYVYLNYG